MGNEYLSLRQLLTPVPLTLVLSWSASTSHAFVRCQTREGVFIHHDTSPTLSLFAHSTSKSSINSEELFLSVSRSFQRWEEASLHEANFNYWQGIDSSLFPTTGEKDSISSLFFLSQTPPDSALKSYLSRNTLGMTQLWYDQKSGQISEFDIILNDIDFEFTTHPEDSSGSGSPKNHTHPNRPSVFIENVMTHELGHALGLSHSAALQSTMLFAESPEQAHLGCDDQIGIQTLTTRYSVIPHRGKIIGRIRSPSGDPILGAHVIAISINRGTLFSTTLSNPEGLYVLENLEPGPYTILIEPFFAGPKVLPEYYEKSNPLVCRSHSEELQPFNRTFLFNHNSTELKTIEVKAESLTTLEDTQVECPKSIKRTKNTHEQILSATWSSVESPSHFGLSYQNSNTSLQMIDLGKLSGSLRIHGLSYSLYSPIRIQLMLFDENKQLIPAHLKAPIDSSDSGFTNYDIELEAHDLPIGRYFLEVHHEILSIQDYPAGLISLDSRPFVVLLGTLNRQPLELEDILPDHPRCKSTENFPPYHSPALAKTMPPHSPAFYTSYTEASPGCTRTFLPQDSPFSHFLQMILSWIFYFIVNYFILKIFKYLLTTRPIDKLKLWD